MRREIRQLTDKDREAFFDAMETLYRLPTAEGNAIYGKEYKVRWVSRRCCAATVYTTRYDRWMMPHGVERWNTRVGNLVSTGGGTS